MPSPGTSTARPISSRRARTGARCPGPRPPRRSTRSPTACLLSGVRKGDTFAILGSTRLEWVLFDFALGLIGAVGAPIYMNNSPKDARYVAEHSEAVGVLFEDEEQRAKLDGLELEHVLTFADLPALRERGRAHAAENPSAVEEAAAAIDENDLFT